MIPRIETMDNKALHRSTLIRRRGSGGRVRRRERRQVGEEEVGEEETVPEEVLTEEALVPKAPEETLTESETVSMPRRLNRRSPSQPQGSPGRAEEELAPHFR